MIVNEEMIVSEDTSKYPLQELYDIIQNYMYQMSTTNNLLSFNNEIENFKCKLIHTYNIPDDEKQYVNINYSVDDNKFQKLNLFTSCLLIGRYVPFFLMKDDPKIFEFIDGNRIEYDDSEKVYRYIEDKQKQRLFKLKNLIQNY